MVHLWGCKGLVIYTDWGCGKAASDALLQDGRPATSSVVLRTFLRPSLFFLVPLNMPIVTCMLHNYKLETMTTRLEAGDHVHMPR